MSQDAAHTLFYLAHDGMLGKGYNIKIISTINVIPACLSGRQACRESFLLLSVMLACPASLFTIPDKQEGFRTSRNDGQESE